MTAIPAWLLTKVIGKHLENLSIMAWALIAGGVAMWLIDALFSSSGEVSEFRRVRIQMDGQMWEVIEWNMEYAPERTDQGIPNLDEFWVGVQKLPLGSSTFRSRSASPCQISFTTKSRRRWLRFWAKTTRRIFLKPANRSATSCRTE